MFYKHHTHKNELMVFEGGCAPLNDIRYIVCSLITNFAEVFRRGPINNNPFLLMSKPSETLVGKLEQNY